MCTYHSLLKNRLIIILALTSFYGMAQKPLHSLDKQIENIFEEWDKPGKPGASVGIIQNGKMVYLNRFGNADLENPTPVTKDTKFKLMALRNQIVAFAVLLLESEGKLSMNDDIRKYLPEMHEFEKRIRIHHLLTHTSGLPDFIMLQRLTGMQKKAQKTREQTLKMLYNLTNKIFKSGDKADYTDAGILLASEIVAKIAQTPFKDFVTSRIFKPLGMTNTVFGDIDDTIIQNRAQIYSRNGDTYKNESLNFYTIIDFAIYSNGEDMARWMLNFSKPKIGNRTLINKMFKQTKLNNGQTVDIVPGQYMSNYKGLQKFQQHGRVYGNTTYIAHFPEQDFGIVVLGNAYDFRAKEAALKIADLFLEKEFKQAPITKINIEKKKREIIKLTDSKLKKFCGYYWNDASSYSRKIYLKDGKLFYFRSDGNESELAPIGKNTFVLTEDPERYTITFENQSGKEVMLFAVGDEYEYRNEKYAPVVYDSKQLLEFTGLFLCKNLKAVYRVEMQNGKLIASTNNNNEIIITPYKTDAFTSKISYFSNLEYKRNDNGSIIGFIVKTSNVGSQFFKKID